MDSTRIAQIRKIEKVGRFGEKTTHINDYGKDAVKLAKRDMGREFNSNPKLIEVEILDGENNQVLHLVKNPMTLECTKRVSA